MTIKFQLQGETENQYLTKLLNRKLNTDYIY